MASLARQPGSSSSSSSSSGSGSGSVLVLSVNVSREITAGLPTLIVTIYKQNIKV